MSIGLYSSGGDKMRPGREADHTGQEYVGGILPPPFIPYMECSGTALRY
jgi:hypothetical protein